MEVQIKEQTPQLTLLYCGRTVRSCHWSCSTKKTVLKNFTISTGNPCWSLFLKSCRAEGLQLYQKDTPMQVVFCDYCKIFKTNYLTSFMVHYYMGLKVQGLGCMTVSGFRVQVTGLVFCF